MSEPSRDTEHVYPLLQALLHAHPHLTLERISRTNLAFTEEMLGKLKRHKRAYQSMAGKFEADIRDSPSYITFVHVIRFASLLVNVTEEIEFVRSSEHSAADLRAVINGRQIHFKVSVLAESQQGVIARSFEDIVRELRENVARNVEATVALQTFVLVIIPQTIWNSGLLLDRIAVDLEGELRSDRFSAISGLILLYPPTFGGTVIDGQARSEGVLILNRAANYPITDDVAHRMRKMLRNIERLKRFALAYIREQAIAIAQAIIALGIGYVILLIANQYVSSSFPHVIAPDLALGVLQSIIAADGALLGFVAVIAVFVFQALQTRLFSDPQALKRWRKIEEQRTNVFWITLFTIIMFVLSILSSMASISSVTSPALPGIFYWPVAWMLEGLAGVSTMIWYSTRW